MKSNTCKNCKRSFDYEDWKYPPVLCPACYEVAHKSEIAAELARKEQARIFGLTQTWEAICPPAYNSTIESKLPRTAPLGAVNNWTMGARGLLMTGATGSGKTRCAYLLLKKQHFAGYKVAAVSGYDVAKYPVMLMVSAAAAGKFLTEAMEADILLLDDVFKIKLSERVEEALFCIVEERTAYNRPIIATMNDTGATLAARISSDRAEPLIRRLRECCEPISCL